MRNTNPTSISIILLFLGLSFLFYSFLPDEDIRVRKIKSALQTFYTDYHQQKAYLHLDQSEYTVGDDVWFKAYLLDAYSKKHDSISDNLYVEMVNPRNQTIFTKRLKLVKGMAAGDFFLYDTLSEGIYKIRAYTNWMQNFNPGYIYSREIKIKNSTHEIFKNDWLAYRKIDRKVKRNASKIEVHFLPEGGDLVDGIKTRVAFKALNGNGNSVKIRGSIQANKREIVSFASEFNGMGDFYFTPNTHEKYSVTIEYGDSKKKRIALPEIKKNGIVMNILDNGMVLSGKVHSNRFITNDRYANEIIVLGHQNGKIFFNEIYLLDKDSLQFEIPLNYMPQGVNHITLFNGRGYPECERLYYHNTPKKVETKILLDKPEYNAFEKIRMNLKISKENLPVQGTASLNVVDRDNAVLDEINIWNYLTLISDLQGKIESPGFYFTGADDAQRAVELLMLTQGWRRFVWKDIIDGNYPPITNPVEEGIMIAGKITRDFFEIPLKDAKVTLSVLDTYNDFFQQVTPKDGSFMFKDLEYSDTVSLEIEARRENGSKNLQIILNYGERPMKNEVKNEIKYEKSRIKGPYYKYAKEIENENEKEEDEGIKQPEIFKIYGEPDAVVDMKDIPDGTSDLLDALKGRVPGLMISGDRAIIRGVHTFYGSTDPLLVVDGVPADFNYIHAIPPSDVEKVEILKGPSAAMYGSRGANGVIAIYTKRGRFMIRGEIKFDILGYYSAREFYSPNYEDTNPTDIDFSDKRKTIFWNPSITFDQNGEASVSFYNSEAKAISVSLEGLTDDGEIIYQKLELSK